MKTAGLAAAPGATFMIHLWQHLLDLAALQLATPLGRVRLAPHLDGQPLQARARRARPCGGAPSVMRAAWRSPVWVAGSSMRPALGRASACVVSHERETSQPRVQVLARTRGGRPLWAFELWHEALLPAARARQDSTRGGRAAAPGNPGGALEHRAAPAP